MLSSPVLAKMVDAALYLPWFSNLAVAVADDGFAGCPAADGAPPLLDLDATLLACLDVAIVDDEANSLAADAAYAAACETRAAEAADADVLRRLGNLGIPKPHGGCSR